MAPPRQTPDHRPTGGRASARPDTDTAAHDLDAELATLASAIANPQAHAAAARLVNAAAFYRPPHAAIWQAITDLHALGRPVTRITVADHLRAAVDDRTLEPALRLLPALEDRPWMPAAVTWHARIVARNASRRAAHDTAQRLTQAVAIADPATFRAELDHAVGRLTQLARGWDQAEADQ